MPTSWFFHFVINDQIVAPLHHIQYETQKMPMLDDFVIHKIKDTTHLKNIKNNAPRRPDRFSIYPLTYIFISKEDKYLIKVGRSENPYYRLCKFNEQTRKYLNGLEFEPLIVIQAPMFLENYIKRALKGSEYKISSRIDGSTEVFHLKNFRYKKPMTIVNKVIKELCL